MDPTIFERSFARTLGLSKLLVLEKLPRPDDRDRYLMQRRAERGRPPLNLSYRNRHKLAGNVKDQQPDDVAEWIEDEEISNYHTFKVPYGPKFYAKKVSYGSNSQSSLVTPFSWCFCANLELIILIVPMPIQPLVSMSSLC